MTLNRKSEKSFELSSTSREAVIAVETIEHLSNGVSLESAMKITTFISIILFAICLFSCSQQREDVTEQNEDVTEQNGIGNIVEDGIWLYVKAQSVHIRKIPELLSETLGILYYGDSVYGCYSLDSIWFRFHYENTDSAFLKVEYLTDQKPKIKQKASTTLSELKKELRETFANANIRLRNDQFVYPIKKHTVVIPENIKTSKLGDWMYPDLKKLNDLSGLGGIKVCMDISADKNTLYTSTAKKGMEMTFYSLGALNMQLVNLVDTATNLSSRIFNGDIEFIKGEIVK
jgi:hypothetical protein